MHVTDYLVIVHVYGQCHVLLLYMYMHMQCVYKSVNVTGLILGKPSVTHARPIFAIGVFSESPHIL